MANCSTCRTDLRDGVRFCTQCGAPFSAPPSAPPPSADAPHPVASPSVASPPVASAARDASLDTIVVHQPDRDTVVEPAPLTVMVDQRAPRQRTSHRLPAERSTAATWALVTGLAPFATSVVGNLVASQAGAQLAAGAGSLAIVLGVLTLVFVVNAALLTVCGITGSRGVRETANGYTKGRGLAVAGITLGAINLVLWLAGLVVSVTALIPFFA
jgi:hypothetical protein